MIGIKRILTNRLLLVFGSISFIFFTIKGIVWLLIFYFGFEALLNFLPSV